MIESSFYVPTGEGGFRSTPATTSPWSKDEQHGGPVAALLARAVEQCEPTDHKVISRVTVDFLSTVPQGEAVVSARVARRGRRVELLEADIEADGRIVAVARAWRIDSRPESTPPIGIVKELPSIPPAARPQDFPGLNHEWGYAKAIDWRFVTGAFDQLGAVSVWTRVAPSLVPGEEPTGLQRMMIVADSANGLSAELEFTRWLFVPTSLALTVHRQLEGEWMLLDAHSRIGSSGLGLSHAEIADSTGPVGMVTQSLFVAPRA
ncbi:thioesterase family protein [Phytoactinopolyspora mesophila]|nr:thioesterase family protein [Phytoactinopolyspora mesophila]